MLGLSLLVMVSCHVPAPTRDAPARPVLTEADLNAPKTDFKGLVPKRPAREMLEPAIAWRDITPPLGMDGSSPALRNLPVTAGDQLRIVVYRERDLSNLFVVSDDGSIDYPLLGRLRVDGQTPAQIAQTIRNRLRGDYLVAPHVMADRVEFCAQQITQHNLSIDENPS